jgi:hypothetical protein
MNGHFTVGFTDEQLRRFEDFQILRINDAGDYSPGNLNELLQAQMELARRGLQPRAFSAAQKGSVDRPVDPEKKIKELQFELTRASALYYLTANDGYGSRLKKVSDPDEFRIKERGGLTTVIPAESFRLYDLALHLHDVYKSVAAYGVKPALQAQFVQAGVNIQNYINELHSELNRLMPNKQQEHRSSKPFDFDENRFLKLTGQEQQ